MKDARKNWKTTLMGILVIIAQVFIDSQKKDATVNDRLQSVSACAVGIGLIAARDGLAE